MNKNSEECRNLEEREDVLVWKSRKKLVTIYRVE
jgi:hypothetical protein